MQGQSNTEVHLTLTSGHSTPAKASYSLYTLSLVLPWGFQFAVSPDHPVYWSHCHLPFVRSVITIWKYLILVFTSLSPSADLSTPQRKDITLLSPALVPCLAQSRRQSVHEWMNEWMIEGSLTSSCLSSVEYKWKTWPYTNTWWRKSTT